MQVNLGIWDKLNRIVVVLLFIAGALGVFFWYLPLIQQNERLRKQILELDSKLQQMDRQWRELKAAMDSMNDPQTLERLARERLGLAKTNETVVFFQPPPAGNPPLRR